MYTRPTEPVLDWIDQKFSSKQLIHDARTEPWRQITARLLSPEGLLVAVCYTPSFHDGAES